MAIKVAVIDHFNPILEQVLVNAVIVPSDATTLDRKLHVPANTSRSNTVNKFGLCVVIDINWISNSRGHVSGTSNASINGSSRGRISNALISVSILVLNSIDITDMGTEQARGGIEPDHIFVHIFPITKGSVIASNLSWCIDSITTSRGVICVLPRIVSLRLCEEECVIVVIVVGV